MAKKVINDKLPEELASHIRSILGQAYDDFIASFNKNIRKSIRVNRSKIKEEELQNLLKETYKEVEFTKIPWTEEGFYYQNSNFAPGRTMEYLAGLFYIQEASAMLPAQILRPNEDGIVLDLCAAPGGKASKIAADFPKIKLIANDISLERSLVLLRNLEQCGLSNTVVLHEEPKRLINNFKGYFDAIILDAPCSGEGMIRRDKKALESWSNYNIQSCEKIQNELLSYAAKMLKEGGKLLYSTCTFNIYENERQIYNFLLQNADFNLLPIILPYGRKDILARPLSLDENMQNELAMDLLEHGLFANKEEVLAKIKKLEPSMQEACMRVWPHLHEGDGHFVCLLQKKADIETKPIVNLQQVNKKTSKLQVAFAQIRPHWEAFLQKEALQSYYKSYEESDLSKFQFERNFLHESIFNEDFYKGLHVLKRGLLLAEVKTVKAKNKAKKDQYKFIPSQALAIARGQEFFKFQLQLTKDDKRLQSYIKGESLAYSPDELVRHLEPKEREEALEILASSYLPYVLVCYETYPLGLTKLEKNFLKNLYPLSWLRNEGF